MKDRRMLGALLLPLAFASTTAFGAEQAGQGASPPPGGPMRRPAAHRRHQPNDEARVKALSSALKLDPAQEVEVRRALQARREQLRQLLSRPADPGLPRAAAFQAINDRSFERIRAVLNEQQKKLYIQPPARPASPGEGGRGVEEWMSAHRTSGN